MNIKQDILSIAGHNCRIYTTTDPQAILIQPSARHEEKGGGTYHEAELIASMTDKGFALLAFDTEEWAQALMPWHDEAVVRDKTAGLYAQDTLSYIEQELLPLLRSRLGALPCVIGGYSLGALFALWAARESDTFDAVAAASPSLWIKKWGEYASTHPIHSKYVYLSIGDREEHCRNLRMRQIGNCIREEHLLLTASFSSSATTLEWNPGGHFGQEAERTARAFAWCMNRL